MKKITHEQSRRNSARRQRRLAARHGQAGHWGPRSEPMLTSGKISYEIGGNVEATPLGGIFAMHRLVTRLGLVQAIDANVELLKIHLPYHESDHVLTLAYSVLCGGTRLEDVDRLRTDVPLMNGLGARLLPDPTTTGDFLRRFAESDLLTLMDAINSVRPQLWTGRGADLLGEVAYLDADGTIVPTTGELKQGMDISYKGIWGYAPLLITLANTREVLYLVNRPGNAPSHLDAASWIDKAIALAAPHANHEDVAEFTHRPSKCQRPYRVVALRKNISRMKGEHALIDEVRYYFYVTTYPADTHPPARIIELANQRCDQENIVGQLKSGINALHAPVDDLHSNWAYMLIAAVAWNIKSWHAMMMHRKTDRHRFIRMEFKRFLDTVIRIPAMVAVRARAIVVRLLAHTVNVDRFFTAWATTERTRLSPASGFG